MLATDKQISYLTNLQERYNKMMEATKQYMPASNVEFYHFDYNHERSKGMTTIDASLKIGAFKQLIRNINNVRVLCNLKQL